MTIINAVRSKLKIVAPLSIVALGLYIVSSQNYLTEDDVSIAPTEQSHEVAQTTTKQQASTTQLINEAAKDTLANEGREKIDYPNITPVRLEKPFSTMLEGTDIDGQLAVGEDGKVLVNLEVKDFFDYFLSTVGDVGPERALRELLSVARDSLPPENFEEVRVLLDNYLAYKEEAVQLMARPMLPRDQQTREYQLEMMEEGLRELRELRRQHMPEDQVEAFFGLEEAYEEYTIASVKIQFDQTMSAEEKAGMMQYHRSLLPEQIRKTETRIAEESVKNAAVYESIKSGNKEVLVSQLDEFGYSEEKKQEILSHLEAQEKFDRRYQEYLAEKNERLNNIDSEVERDQIVSSLQDEYFSNEQERTQARLNDLRS